MKAKGSSLLQQVMQPCERSLVEAASAAGMLAQDHWLTAQYDSHRSALCQMLFRSSHVYLGRCDGVIMVLLCKEYERC